MKGRVFGSWHDHHLPALGSGLREPSPAAPAKLQKIQPLSAALIVTRPELNLRRSVTDSVESLTVTGGVPPDASAAIRWGVLL